MGAGGGRVLAASIHDQPLNAQCGQLNERKLPVDNGLVDRGGQPSVAAMTKTRDLADVVDRNKEEQDAIYDRQMQTHGWVKKIAAVQKKHGHQPNAIEGRLEAIEATQGEHGAKLDSHSAKLDSHSAKLDSHSAKLDSHGAKLDEILGILKEP